MRLSKLRILPVIIGGVLLLARPSLAVGEFIDVSREAWYYEDLMELRQAGIVDGYEDSSFRPDENISFSEFLKLAVLATRFEEIELEGDGYWKNAIYDYAVLREAIYPKDFSQWDFNKPISRESMALIAYGIDRKILGNPDLDLDLGPGDLEDFEDINEITRYEVVQAYGKGLIRGRSRTIWDPDGLTSRAEAIAVIRRLIDRKKA